MMDLITNLVNNGVFTYLLALLAVSQLVMTVNLYIHKGQVSKLSLFRWNKKEGFTFLPIEFHEKTKKPPPNQEGAD